MRFRRDAQLDTSQVSDRRSAGPLLAGGGGLVGVIFLVIQLLTGSGGEGGPTIPSLGNLDTENDLSGECDTGEDANQREDCQLVGVVNSVQAFWEATLPGYRRATTVLYKGSVQTACGTGTSDVGPFYCSADEKIYIDLGFYDDLRTRFGAQGGPSPRRT